MLVAGSFSLFIIATAWMMYRPVLAAGLLLTALTPYLYLFQFHFGFCVIIVAFTVIVVSFVLTTIPVFL